MEIEFQDNGCSFATITAMQEISSLGETVSYRTAKDKPRLIGANKRGNMRLEPSNQNFRDPFNSRVLQGNGNIKVAFVVWFSFLFVLIVLLLYQYMLSTCSCRWLFKKE